jgi:hypothetical protein
LDKYLLALGGIHYGRHGNPDGGALGLSLGGTQPDELRGLGSEQESLPFLKFGGLRRWR